MAPPLGARQGTNTVREGALWQRGPARLAGLKIPVAAPGEQWSLHTAFLGTFPTALKTALKASHYIGLHPPTSPRNRLILLVSRLFR